MRIFSTRWVCLVCTISLAVSSARAATFSFKAVKRDSTTLPAPTTTVIAAPGQTITAEMFISGWNADQAGCLLRTYQYAIDGFNGFILRPTTGDPLLLAEPCGFDRPPTAFCETSAECPVETPSCEIKTGVCELPCLAGCPPEWPVCVSEECVGDMHTPEAFSTIVTKTCVGGSNAGVACTLNTNCNSNNCADRADWCHRGFQGIPATGIKKFVNVEQGSTTISGDGPADTAQSCYGGTVCIQLTEAACGVISVPIVNDQTGKSTFFQCDGGNIFFPLLQGLTINVQRNGVPVQCPGAIEIVSTDPPNCRETADARAPHRSSPPPPPALVALGERIFKLTFSENIAALFSQSNFALSFVPVTVGAPGIQNYDESGGNVVILTLNRPASTINAQMENSPVPRYTCITVTHVEMSLDNKRCWLHFPGDTDLNLTNEFTDLIQLTSYVNGPQPAIYLCDMNYSGACTAADIIEWLDMANGGGLFGPWLNTVVQGCPAPGQ